MIRNCEGIYEFYMERVKRLDPLYTSQHQLSI